MTPETSRGQREKFSSFWVQEVAGPARETYLKLLAWKNQAIGYLGLGKDKPMAAQRAESPDPRMTQDNWKAQQRFISEGLARSLRNTKIDLLITSGLVAGALAIGYLGLTGEQTKTSANVDSQDNARPSITAPAPAEIVNTLAPTPTPDLPTETPLPPSATFIPTETATEATTEILEPTAEATRTERYVVDIERGERESLDCRDIDVEKQWQECYRRIVQKVTPLLQEDWGQFTTDSSSYPGYWKDYPNVRVTVYQDLAYLRAIPFYWNRPDGWIADEKRPDYIFAFGLQEPGKGKVILPAMPFDAYAAGRNAIGVKVAYYLPVKELLQDLQPGEVLHQVYVQHSWWVEDKVAEFILSQEDIYPNDHILPLHLFNDITKN